MADYWPLIPFGIAAGAYLFYGFRWARRSSDRAAWSFAARLERERRAQRGARVLDGLPADPPTFGRGIR